MEKIKIFFNKNGFISVIVLTLFMLMQNCAKNRNITRLVKKTQNLELKNDSLLGLVLTPQDSLLLQYKSEFNVYNKLNDEMSNLDRQGQLMNFQIQFIITPKKEVENKIKQLEK